jgi:hypothetical protein
VIFVNDEARSYIARTDEHFDVIEASYIDTWAAAAAGALSCTENSIYTVEAWNLFLKRLTPGGVLSFSRWYKAELPAEAYRLTSLGVAALRMAGVADTRAHILMIRNLRQDQGYRGTLGAVTILIGKEPFTSAELDKIEAVTKQMRFDIVLSPRFAIDPVFAMLASGRDDPMVSADLHVNLSPPTDNTPFFFYATPPREALSPRSFVKPGGIVGGLFLFVTLLVVLYILLPVLQTLARTTLAGAVPDLLFFAAIGLAFMLIEISQMQRFMLFLGHPTYALSVVLFALLLSGGAGSYATRKSKLVGGHAVTCLLLLLLIVFTFGLLTPLALTEFVSEGKDD